MNSSMNTIESLKDQMKESTEIIVLQKFPKKILDLNALLKDDKFNVCFCPLKQEINIPVPEVTKMNSNSLLKKRKNQSELTSAVDDIDSDDSKDEENAVVVPFLYPSGVVHCNLVLEEFVDLIKPYLLGLIDDTLALSIGINLRIPKVEDGNNFGVEIQEEVISNIIAAENDVCHRLHEIHKYYTARAYLVAKVAKHPHNEDYRRAVHEKDQMFYRFLCISLITVRNHYMLLHDLVLKNLKKIKSPKSGVSTEMLY